MSDKQIQVILDIFSGNMNPSWTLTEEQLINLERMLTNLSSAEPFQKPVLGYRGFIIENSGKVPSFPDEIIVYNHILAIRQGEEVSFQSDDNNIEGWLLDQPVN
jgi:hypothetical protein